MMKQLLRLNVVLLTVFLSSQSFSQTLGTIESAEYDPINHRFLISNSTSIVEVDGSGNEVAYFGTEPQASYGMEVMGNALFAITANQIKAYDLTSGLQVSSLVISGVQFLNGMASDYDHRIWVTDFNGKAIYEADFTDLSNPTYVQIVANTVTTPNGICYDPANDRLVFVNWGSSAKIKAVALSDYTVTTLVNNSGVGNIDGIDNDNYGNYYIASWTPARITKYNSDFSVSEIITVNGSLQSPADIAYAEEIDTLIIPNSANGTVRFVGFSPSTVEANEENPIAFSCYPNPITDQSVLSFNLHSAEVTKIEVLDTQGRLIEELLMENLPATQHKIVLGDLDLPSGNYLWRITSGDVIVTQPFVK
jgi:sugar lactone lactonase YvrE